MADIRSGDGVSADVRGRRSSQAWPVLGRLRGRPVEFRRRLTRLSSKT